MSNGSLESFRGIQRLRNHWLRPSSPPAYYWYLTFEHSRELHSLARECQKAIAFPYYDLTPLRDLHLTLIKVASVDSVEFDDMASIEAAAVQAAQKISPFKLTIGSLGGTAGAVGFGVFPPEPIVELRNAFRVASLSAYPDALVGDSAFHPHVTIAYANSDVPAANAIAAIEKLSSAHVDTDINDAALVLLARGQQSYTWRVVSRIPFAGFSLTGRCLIRISRDRRAPMLANSLK